MRILLVEDDELIAIGIQEGLEKHGFSTEHVHTAASAETALTGDTYGAMILDLGLPDRDGMTLLPVLRSIDPEIPILVLSARDTVEHRLAGLGHGADDYLIKPFDLRELAARLHALVRRVAGRGIQTIVAGPLKLEPESGSAWMHGVPIALSRMEVDLIGHLANADRRWTSVAQLNQKLYGLSSQVGRNVLNVHVYNIRRKLGAEAIESSRGLGLRLGWSMSR